MYINSYFLSYFIMEIIQEVTSKYICRAAISSFWANIYICTFFSHSKIKDEMPHDLGNSCFQNRVSWWFYRYIFIFKLSNLYAVNMYNFLYVNYTSVKWFKNYVPWNEDKDYFILSACLWWLSQDNWLKGQVISKLWE